MANNGKVSSVTQRGLYEPFELQVARGQIGFHRSLTVFGYNADVDASEETVWPDGGIMPHPATALQMKVSSDSADDTSSGTGARTLLVEGLDANYTEISEVVTLNGQTAVTTTNSFLRINRMAVATAGSGLGNAGVIYIGTGVVTLGVPATIYNLMYAGYNSTTTGHYTVPAGYTAYMYQGLFSAGQAGGTAAVTGRLVTTGTNGLAYTAAVVTLNNGAADYRFELPLAIPEKTDIEARAVGSSANNAVSSMFILCLIANNYPAGST